MTKFKSVPIEHIRNTGASKLSVNNHMPIRLVTIGQYLEWRRERISILREKNPNRKLDSRSSLSNIFLFVTHRNKRLFNVHDLLRNYSIYLI